MEQFSVSHYVAPRLRLSVVARVFSSVPSRGCLQHPYEICGNPAVWKGRVLPSLPLCCAIPVTLSGKVSRGGRAPQTTAPGLLVTRLMMDYSPSAEFVVRRQLVIVQCQTTERQLLDFKLVADASVFGGLQVCFRHRFDQIPFRESVGCQPRRQGELNRCYPVQFSELNTKGNWDPA